MVCCQAMDAKEKWSKFRRSKWLISFTILLVFVRECTTVTLVQSLAPALIKANDCVEYKLRGTAADGNETSPSVSVSSNGTDSPIFSSLFCRKDSVVHCIAEVNITFLSSGHRSPNDSGDQGRDSHGHVIYCEKDSFPFLCLEKVDIMHVIAPTVSYLNAIGPLFELIVNPLAGMICSRFGHRIPFLVGAFIQLVAASLFLLATNTPLLFVARVTDGISNTICAISAMMTMIIVFPDAEVRAKVSMITFASSYPIGALLSYMIGNAGYSFFGPRVPFGMLLGLTLLDGSLRLVIDTSSYEKDQVSQDTCIGQNGKPVMENNQGSVNSDNNPSTEMGLVINENDPESITANCTSDRNNTTVLNSETDISSLDQKNMNGSTITVSESETTPVLQKQPMEGTYRNYLSNPYIITVLSVTFVSSFAIYTALSTAPNWVTNVLHAQQWQLGVVLAVSSVVHLASNLLIGMIVTKRALWAFMVFGCVLASIAFIVYPLLTNVWLTVVPEMLLRVAFGIISGMVTVFISIICEQDYGGDTAKGMALFIASYGLGCMFGPLSGGLLSIISLMTLYYIIWPLLVCTACATLYLRTYDIWQ